MVPIELVMPLTFTQLCTMGQLSEQHPVSVYCFPPHRSLHSDQRKGGPKKRMVGTARALQVTLVAEALGVLSTSGDTRKLPVACRSHRMSVAELKAHFKSSNTYCL